MHNRRIVRPRVYAVGALLLAGVLTGCEKLLEAEAPQLIEEASLQQPANASVLVSGVVADFECAFASYIATLGAISDEYRDSQANADTWQLDRRTNTANGGLYATNTCGGFAAYTPVSIARYAADNTVRLLSGWTDEQVPNRQKLIGQAATYAGYSLVLLGEGMCSAALNLGPELQPPALFSEAVARFTKAIDAATAANDAATLNLARLGRARAELDLGGAQNLAAAAADAAPIPATFVATTSPDAINARRQNLVFINISQSSFSTVDTSFRNVLVPGGTTQDPRVAVIDLNRNGTAAGSRLFIPAKDNANNLPVRVGSYAEAQLIIAENAAATGDLNGAVTAINNARSRTAGVPPYVLPAGATAADVLAQIVEERRRELFMEGHRLGDLRRYNLPFLPASGTPYQYGGVYGTQTCFPLPDVERINNPTIAGTQ